MSIKIENFYDHITKDDDKLRHYPNEDKLKIKIPFRMIIGGPSGSGKTNILLNLMKLIGIFDKKLKIKIILAITTAKDMPQVEDCNEKENTLLIVDDMICEDKKELAIIGKFWTQARKKGVSMAFLTQAFYAVPKIIRQNTQYILMKRIDTPRDLKAMLSECSLGVEMKELFNMYNYAMRGDAHTSFFMIDRQAPKELRFRANFDPIPLPS